MVTDLTTQDSQIPIDGTRQRLSAGLIIRQKEPLNLETPFDHVDSYLTPTELFYVRSHFAAPTLNAESYRLQVDGAVTEYLATPKPSTDEMFEHLFAALPARLHEQRLIARKYGAKPSGH